MAKLNYSENLNVTVIGCGRWGTFIAWYLDSIKKNVTLYGRKESPKMQQLLVERSNGFIKISESTKLSTSLECVEQSEVIIIAIASQGLRELMNLLRKYSLKNKIFILCMKGIEITTGKRLSEIVKENTDCTNEVAVWLGPGHVQQFLDSIPNCMVIDCDKYEIKHFLVESFSSNLIRFYIGTDILGNEIGAASKNVIGIAAGMLDGLGLASLKGALMSRGTLEISRLIKALGGNPLSAYGLCHLGDYEATVFSKYSNNRRFGENYVLGQNTNELVEGYYTVKALINIEQKYGVELPICNAVYDVIYEGKNIKNTFNKLFCRSIKQEY